MIKLNVTQRYLASSFILPFIASTLFFVIFLLTFQMFRLVKILIAKDVEVLTVIELVSHICVSFLPMAIPLSALFATIFTLNKLSEDSEIVAMRSFGLKKWDIFVPFLVIGIVISLTIYSLNKNLIPYSKGNFKNTIIKLTSKGLLTGIKAENFFTDIPGVTLFSERVSEDGQKFENLFIRIDDGDENEKIITAKHGTLVKRVLSSAETPSIRFYLKNGSLTQEAGDGYEKILFEEYDFPILKGGSRHGFITKDSMLSNSELRKKYAKNESLLSSYDQKDSRLSSLTKSIVKTKLEYFSRLNIPLQCLVFVFLGFSLGIKKSRGSSKNNGALGLIALISYYIVFFSGISLAKKGGFPASIAIFLPTLVTFFFAGYLYKKLDWNS